MKTNSVNFEGGTVIRDNEKYVLTDITYLQHMTVSKTELKPHQCTNGHFHDGLEEVYTFIEGEGTMRVGTTMHEVSAGSIVLIKGGEFHRVFNDSDKPLVFIAIFEKYERAS
jgi:quercetin dioxygenase-like cupin family protein